MIVELTLPLLSAFLEELLGEREKHELKDHRIVELIKHIDTSEIAWHVTEDARLYRKKEWLKCLEAFRQKKERHEAENALLEKRKQGFLELRLKIAITLKAQKNDPTVHKLALNIFNNHKIELAAHFGFNLKDVPILDKPYLIMTDEEYGYFEI